MARECVFIKEAREEIMKKRTIRHAAFSVCFFLFFITATYSSTGGRLDYLGSDQTYDRLPGTLVTPHTPWSKPLPGGGLKAIIIVQDRGAREVVELAQRLDLDYTTLTTAKYDSFFETEHAGRHAVPRYAQLIEELARKRLHPASHYDLILTCKIAWAALPDFVRENILKRVQDGAGLVYVEASGTEKPWGGDFSNNVEGAAADITANLPLETMALVPVKDATDGLEKLKVLKGAHWHTQDGWRSGGWWTIYKSPITVKGWQYGKGRIVLIDYYEGKRMGSALTPQNVQTGLAGYDLSYALISRACLWAAGRQSPAQIVFKTLPDKIIPRENLKSKNLPFNVTVAPEWQLPFFVEYKIRNFQGEVFSQKIIKSDKIAKKEDFRIELMPLPAGEFLVDLWTKDETGNVLDFASLAFTVKTAEEITAVTTRNDRYRPGENVEGNITMKQPLATGQSLVLLVKDTWGRDILKKQLQPAGEKADFTFTVDNPLSALWDIQARIEDKDGVVTEKTGAIGIPNYAVDNYFLSLFYGAAPDTVNQLQVKYSRPLYGVNAANVRSVSWGGKYNAEQARLCGADSEAELAVRNNLRVYSSVFPNGFASGSKPGPHGPVENACLTDTNNTSAVNDGQAKNWKQWVDKDAAVTRRFGTIMNSIHAESFLPPNVCFSPTCIAGFQNYIKKSYGTIDKLNAEYGTSYKDFSEVIPLPEPEVFEKKMFPLWLDHKMFMISELYSGAYRGAAKRLGQYHDVVRASTIDAWFVPPGGDPQFDWPEMFKDVDSYQTEIHSFHQWEAEIYELTGALSNGKGLQVVRIDPWWYWETDHWKMKIHPWWNLFHGGQMTVFHGWGNGYDMAGGCHPLSADWSEPMEWFRTLTDGIKEVQSGIGPMLIQSHRLRDKSVVIVLSLINSYASLLDPLSGMNYDNNHRDFFVALRSMGITPDFIGEADLTADRIKKSGYKVIVLPYNRAMSEGLANALRDFVKSGGLLMTDDKPGTLTEHCRQRPQSVVADLFPSFGTNSYSRPVGKGLALYLGGALMGMEGRINHRDFGVLQGLQETVEKYAGLGPRVRLLDRFGVERKDIFRSCFANGETLYLCLLREPNIKEDETGDATTVVLPRKYHVYDARAGSYLGESDRVELSVPQYEAKVLALYPLPLSGVSLIVPKKTASPGSVLEYTIQCQVAGAKDKVPIGEGIHLVVFGPDDKEMPCYTRNHIFQGGSFRGGLPIALNAVPGRYKIKITSIATGHRAEACFDVNP